MELRPPPSSALGLYTLKTKPPSLLPLLIETEEITGEKCKSDNFNHITNALLNNITRRVGSCLRTLRINYFAMFLHKNIMLGLFVKILVPSYVLKSCLLVMYKIN